MDYRRIQSAFDEFYSYVNVGPTSSEYKHEEKQRRIMLENTMKSYLSFITSNTVEEADDDKLFDVSGIDDEDSISDADIINRMTDVIKVFYQLREKIVNPSLRICSTGGEYFNIIGKKYNIFHQKQDKKVERRDY